MSGNEEGKRVKVRHVVTQFYQRRKALSTRELPRADMSVEGEQSAAREEERLEDEDVEGETYVPSPRARLHGKGLASASGSGAAREEEIEEEDKGADGDGNNGEEEEETFDIDEINPTSYTHMGTPVFRLPLNPDWR
jgi:pyruvate/2-oxoglutarate dehydrogenase complex dihydrolipoamide acyltransferase (E2) component